MANLVSEIVVIPELRPAVYTLHERGATPVQHNVMVHTTKTGMHGGYMVEFDTVLMKEVVVDNRNGLRFLDSKHDDYCWEVGEDG